MPSSADEGGNNEQNPGQHLVGQFSEISSTPDGPSQLRPDSGTHTGTSATLPGQMQAGSSLLSILSPDRTDRESGVQPGEESLGLDTMPPSSQGMQNDHYGYNAMVPSHHADFAGARSTFDYSPFDEPLNWIPPSIYPSPYDAELEQDFSFILPTLEETPNFESEYGLTVPVDSSTHTYHIPSNTSLNANDAQNVPLSLAVFGQSPASSASDGIYHSQSMNSISTNSDLKRKKRKSFAVLDTFAHPRKQKPQYAFPESMDSWSSMSSEVAPEYCSAKTHELVSGYFHQLCLQTTMPPPFQSPAFPPATVFNTCIAHYFGNFQDNLPLIHRPSFGPETHWIVVLAVATIGSTFAKTTYASDIQDAFQEFLRRAVERHADGVPDASLELPIAQARILNLIGLMQSEREQLRALAPRYHADLSRWCLESGVLQLPATGASQATSGALDNVSQRWQVWIKAESLRRIGYLCWMLDCALGYMANARPLCNMDDARTPLPCPETPWNASSAETWATIAHDIPETPSLCVALENLYNSKKVEPSYSDLSQVLIIHALYQRTWEVGTHIKQPLSEWVPTGKARGFLNTPSKDNFWLPLYPLYANWRNSACDCLDVIHWQASSVVVKASGIEHPLILHLHLARIVLLTPFQEIQDLLFSLIGKVGNSPKASFYVHDGSYQPRNSAKLPQIRKITWRWLREDQHKARLAMVHAGSVFWYVRRYSAMSFFEPLAVYLASLSLWTYASYKSAALDRDAAAANNRPEGGPSGPDASAPVQPSRMERKEHPIKFMSKAANRPDSASTSTMAPSSSALSHSGTDATPAEKEGTAASPSAPIPESASDDDDDASSSSSDEQPEFIHLDRPCDDEMVQHFVRNGHNMSGHMTNVGDICTTPHKVLLEGAKLLRTKLACWGVSREYYDILMKLAELRKAT
ncbi:hypothetical protein CLCR_09564 [Cladophialophora carrionii]|uniref:Xylanolytic transcriptional activator regulatory domain-containing protein n=1 Tax=Cladophialophora carrionii TaxID=86049 RepID=A0A1C1CZ12_9EURO|nr:hypothetical protein CLCR_09564 [Cladophialophora carrionii]